MAAAIVKATTHFEDPDMLAEISAGLGKAMPGLEVNKMDDAERLEKRGN
jgi:pyridoxal 5'-phosphate synthase pdxS subunit